MKRILIVFNMILTSLVLAFGTSKVNASTEEVARIKPVPVVEQEENVTVVNTKETESEQYTVVEEIETMQEKVEEIELPEKGYRYVDCSLSDELQQGVFDICENYGVSFEFVMAVIAQESSFRPGVTGDNGHSKGLMQIQERYHYKTMEAVGVRDLYDPLGNVEVGVAILQSYFEELGDAYHVLMRYNGGEPYATNMMKSGKISDYAKEITERAIRYEEENGI